MKKLIDEIQKIMTNVATGKVNIDEMNPRYKQIYKILDEEYKKMNQRNPNKFTDLWEFYQYWKEALPEYASRRVFIIQLYKDKKEASKNTNCWDIMHPSIKNIAKSRFDSGHFADAVESALKQINKDVKEIYREIRQEDIDGADLMRKAFSPKNPAIILSDIQSESGKNEQQGYMEIFAGSITGIRNPKAHDNIEISKERCIHLLMLASLLKYKLDERMKKL